jgi:hypothetical protein
VLGSVLCAVSRGLADGETVREFDSERACLFQIVGLEVGGRDLHAEIMIAALAVPEVAQRDSSDLTWPPANAQSRRRRSGSKAPGRLGRTRHRALRASGGSRHDPLAGDERARITRVRCHYCRSVAIIRFR